VRPFRSSAPPAPVECEGGVGGGKRRETTTTTVAREGRPGEQGQRGEPSCSLCQVSLFLAEAVDPNKRPRVSDKVKEILCSRGPAENRKNDQETCADFEDNWLIVSDVTAL